MDARYTYLHQDAMDKQSFLYGQWSFEELWTTFRDWAACELSRANVGKEYQLWLLELCSSCSELNHSYQGHHSNLVLCSQLLDHSRRRWEQNPYQNHICDGAYTLQHVRCHIHDTDLHGNCQFCCQWSILPGWVFSSETLPVAIRSHPSSSYSTSVLFDLNDDQCQWTQYNIQSYGVCGWL